MELAHRLTEDPAIARILWHGWENHGRQEQLLPAGDDWIVWLLLAGRGFGKTRTGAETVRALVEESGEEGLRIALIGPTAADVRSVMVEGESGLLAVHPPGEAPVYEPSNHRLVWENGTIATCFSADEPQRLRGPQHHFAWGSDWISVCRARGQFASWNPGNPNRPKLLTVKDTDPEFRMAKRIAADVIAGKVPDPTFGATSYKAADQPWPYSWGHFRLPLTVIGQHAFYNLAAR